MSGQTTLEALERAQRLQAFGIAIRSEELRNEASKYATFAARGGNRRMRRAAARAKKRGNR